MRTGIRRLPEVKRMHSARPAVSIIICTNRAPASLDILVGSIGSQAHLDRCELVLVDNGIGPDRAVRVMELLEALPCATVYAKEPAPGIWAARKTSYEKASGEWFFILDDDNRLGAGALDNLLGFMGRHPEVGGICPRIVADWVVEPPGWVQQAGRLWCLSYTESGSHSPGIEETVWPPGSPDAIHPPGGGMVIRREAAEAFLRSYAEIPESLRVSRLGSEDYAQYSFVGRCGFATAYVPSITVYHHLPEGRAGIWYLTRLNLKMAYAYGQLAQSGHGLGVSGTLRSAMGFAKATFAGPPFHPWAWWLKLARTAGYAAGLFRVKLSRNGV